MYQIPKAKRDDGEKLFMGELTKTSNAGKNSPGPVYMFSDHVKYDQVSTQISQNQKGVIKLIGLIFNFFRHLDGQWEQK